MKSLREIYEQHSTPEYYGDKGTAHSYIDEYERLLSPYRDMNGNLLEIGIAYGHSIALWSKYFPNAMIYGVDIANYFCHNDHIDRSRVKLDFFSATDVELMLLMYGKKKFSVVIDDGSHQVADQVESFRIIEPLLEVGGIYIIEDIQNIDEDRDRFLKMTNKPVEILDLRNKQGKYDDIMVIVRG